MDSQPSKRAQASGADGWKNGPQFAALCVFAASVGCCVEVMNEALSHQYHENTTTFFSALSCLSAGTAIAFGSCALLSQVRRWSRRTRKRLWIGLPLATLTLVSAVPNFYEKPIPQSASDETPQQTARMKSPPSVAADTPSAPNATDNVLFKPGWYGELQQDGLLVVVSSFGDQTTESKQFNGRLLRPVSYASLAIINLGSPEPVQVNKLEVELVLDTGKRTKSLAVAPLLLQKASANDDLLRRLKLPKTLAAGEMFPDIPVCLNPGASWSNVAAVAVAVGAHERTVPGRVMSSEEKRTLIEKATPKPSGTRTNVSAEAWYKGL